MSFSDRMGTQAARPIRLHGLAAAAVAVLLAACTAQPLYAPTVSGRSVTTALDRITIDPVATRVAQQVRNKLIFDLNSKTGAAAAYRMRLAVSNTEIPLGVTPVESAPAYSVTVTATYTVTSLATGDIVFRETSRATASYDRVNQVFANVRGRRDAENRAAVLLATDIRIRLSAAAARGIL